MRLKRIIPLVMVAMLLLSNIPFADATATINNNYITWDEAKIRLVQDIVYDDNSFLYIRLNEGIYKIKKDFNRNFISLSEEEENLIEEKVKNNYYEDMVLHSDLQVDEDKIIAEDTYLYYDGIKLLSIENHIEKSKQYNENSSNNEKDIAHRIYFYELSDRRKLYSIKTYLCSYIPPPYTPFCYDYVIVDGEEVTKINVDDNFILHNVIENDDQTVWFYGNTYYGRYTTESTLHLIDNNYNIQSINDKLHVKDINILSRGSDYLIISAFGKPLWETDLKNKENEGFYSINTNGELNKRNEQIKTVKQVFLASNNQIYCISEDNESIINLTINKEIKVNQNEEKTSYEKAKQKWNIINEENNTDSVIREDKDSLIWYLKDGRIYYKENEKSNIFLNGLNVLMNIVKNIYIDKDGGKWFIALAGISYLPPNGDYAENMNGYMTGIKLSDNENIYIDEEKRIWYFGDDIKYKYIYDDAVVADETQYIRDYEKILHEYSEIDNEGFFIYQKENENHQYEVRVLKINRQGNISFSDFIFDQFIESYFAREGVLYLEVEDGLIKIHNGKIYEMRNEGMISSNMSYKFIDDNTIMFRSYHNDYKIITAHIPSFGDIVDKFKYSDQKILFNGMEIPAYEVDGKVAICIEDLVYYGYKSDWSNTERVTRVYFSPQNAKAVDGLIRNEKNLSGNIYYSDVDIYFEGQKVPDYSMNGYSLVPIDTFSQFGEVKKGEIIEINIVNGDAE